MIYTIDLETDEPTMLILKHIGLGDEDGPGVDGAAFAQELLQIDSLGKKRIKIWINSPGGIVTDGYNIYSAILKSKTPVDTYAVGACASIAGVIFQAGRKRTMADYSWLMYHNPFGGDNTKLLDTMKESLITMIEKRSGLSESEVAGIMNRTTYIQPEEAFKLGLCDEIDSSVNLNTKYLRRITDSLQFHKECNKVLNSIINNQNSNTMSMTKVTMRLKLNDAAREEDVVAAIDAIENRAKKAEAEAEDAIKSSENKAKADADAYDKIKAEFDKKKAELDKLKAEMEDYKSQLDAMKKDKQVAEDKAQEDKAKNMVEGYAKAGRIKNEETVKLKWIKLAKEDFDGTEEMVKSLPLNKEAAVITEAVANKIEKGVLPTTALGLTVRNKLKREGKLN